MDGSAVDPGTATGKSVVVDGATYLIEENKEDIFRVAGDPWMLDDPDTPEEDTDPIMIEGLGPLAGITVGGVKVLWTLIDNPGSDDYIQMTTYDTGLADGVNHPLYGTSSIEVNYKHSAMLNGRQFVGNVKLDPNGDTPEEHKEWIIFSEQSQPDVLPISNFINIEDLHGGEIRGMETLLGDIAVFMDKGVFRLSVPSVEPRSWSLAESLETIGCKAPDSIVKYEGGVFFASDDNYYYLNSNFEAIPVTSTIQDDYQTFNDAETKAILDVKKNRLLLHIGTSSSVLYTLDLKAFRSNKEQWSKFTLDPSEGIVNNFITNRDTSVYIMNHYSDDLTPSATQFRLLNVPEGVTPVQSLPSAVVTTGWISLDNLDNTRIIRRINLRYEASGDSEVELYVDEQPSKVWSKTLKANNMSGSPKSIDFRVSRRANSIKLKVEQLSSPSTLEIRRIEVEVD